MSPAIKAESPRAEARRLTKAEDASDADYFPEYGPGRLLALNLAVFAEVAREDRQAYSICRVEIYLERLIRDHCR